MKKRYVTGNDMKKLQGKKGEVLKSSGNINLIKTAYENTFIYTVWNYEENLHFVNTFYEDEALETFNKYKQ